MSERPYFYLGNSWGLTKLAGGQLFFVNTDDRQIAPWIITGGTWENFVDDILYEYIQPGMTVVDVGANIGYYTVRMALKVGPSGMVFAFEPHPQLIPFLTQNIAINALSSRCKVYSVALGDREGPADLLVAPGNLGGGQINEPREGRQGKQHQHFRVDVQALDFLLSETTQIDLMKVDAEGHEPLVLRGGVSLIRRSPNCAFLLEIDRHQWERFGLIPDLLSQIVQNRKCFAVTPETKLVNVAANQIVEYLERASNWSYFFVLPDLSKFLAPIAKFLI